MLRRDISEFTARLNIWNGGDPKWATKVPRTWTKSAGSRPSRHPRRIRPSRSSLERGPCSKVQSPMSKVELLHFRLWALDFGLLQLPFFFQLLPHELLLIAPCR